MTEKSAPNREGHTKEWQDRARVVLDAGKAAQTDASPKQSPEENDNDDAGGRKDKAGPREKNDDPAY